MFPVVMFFENTLFSGHIKTMPTPDSLSVLKTGWKLRI
jgi:hypothetical protein